MCAICGCALHRNGDYGKPTPKGGSHATEHHYVAERFFGRSTNRRGTQREPLFTEDPWGIEGEKTVLCYECHEELLHNPVFLPENIKLFAQLVRARHLDEQVKTGDRSKLAGRIRLLNEVISKGLQATLEDER